MDFSTLILPFSHFGIPVYHICTCYLKCSGMLTPTSRFGSTPYTTALIRSPVLMAWVAPTNSYGMGGWDCRLGSAAHVTHNAETNEFFEPG